MVIQSANTAGSQLSGVAAGAGFSHPNDSPPPRVFYCGASPASTGIVTV
jgi:hypothetical protein